MTSGFSTSTSAWRTLRPELARELTDARLQLHHAAQIVTAMGISYLPKQADDSHTNLGWVEDLSALASHPVHGTGAIQLAVRPHPFALLFLVDDESRDSFLLDGHTIADAADWVRNNLSTHGLDGAAFTLAKHYTIPPRPVGESAPFDASAASAFEELASWYSDATQLFESIVSNEPNAAPVRCWPHHFDVATLIEVAPQKTVGVGMEPGDVYYAEPYFYVNMSPSPTVAPTSELPGGGSWHTHEWIGAVLVGSRVGRESQRDQIAAFLEASRREATHALLR